MDGDEGRLQHRRGTDAAGDRVGNVVQLQVQEQGQPQRGDPANAAGSVGIEEFQPELQAADMGGDLCRDRPGEIQRGRVDGAEDRVRAGRCHDLFSLPRQVDVRSVRVQGCVQGRSRGIQRGTFSR